MIFVKLLVVAAAVCVKVSSADAPTLPLSWTTYTATTVSRTSPAAEPTLWQFQNVRFGVPPTGSMRFSTATGPTSGGSYPEPTGAPACHNISSLRGPQNPPGYAGRPGLGVTDIVYSEDCLFLDIYVPDSVTSTSKVPVIVWFYGGAYISGSKGSNNINNPFYSGTGILDVANATGQDAIFVAGNYRLGAFGWLGGPSYSGMGGLQNVGLYDQRLLLQWVRDNIGSIGGDPDLVSAWGESAGAGSILHHLVANTSTPLFNRAILQSPAFQWQWDQTVNGTLEHVFNVFASKTGCSGNLTCLQNLPLDDDQLVQANIDTGYQIYSETGQFGYGPTVDGALIPALPAQRLSSGNFHKLDSIAVSHVDQEILPIFVPTQITNPQALATFVTAFMPEPSMDAARTAILKNYAPSLYDNMANLSAAAIIRDSSFVCNTRQLFDAYSGVGNVYMLYYAVFAKIPVSLTKTVNLALHGTDLLPTFWNQDFDQTTFLNSVIKKIKPDIGPAQLALAVAYIERIFGKNQLASKYQTYLVTLATSSGGGPNGLLEEERRELALVTPTWPAATTTISAATVFGVPTMASYVDNVFNVNANGFSSIVDPQTPDLVCDFWTNIAVSCIYNQNCTLSQAMEGKREQVVMGGELKGDL